MRVSQLAWLPTSGRGLPYHANSDEWMKLKDQNVLEPLHLETADLSSGRRFVNEVPDDLGQEDVSLMTRSILGIRGIVPRPAFSGGEQAAAENPSPSGTFTGFNHRPTELAMPSVVWVPVVPLSREQPSRVCHCQLMSLASCSGKRRPNATGNRFQRFPCSVRGGG
jgi:hypothetical protein